jgi:Protein of unknown function (DUF3467)
MWSITGSCEMGEQELENVIAFPIEWQFPENLRTAYATNVIVQHNQHEFTIMFFEMHPPFFLGDEEENKEKASKISSVPAECVARIVVAAGRMEEFVSAFQQIFTSYKNGFQDSEDDKDK